MLVAFPEDKQEEVNEGTAEFHEQLMDVVNDPSEQIVKANGIQSVLQFRKRDDSYVVRGNANRK